MTTLEFTPQVPRRRILGKYATKLLRPFLPKSEAATEVSQENAGARTENATTEFSALAALRRQVGSVAVSARSAEQSADTAVSKPYAATSVSQGPLQKQADGLRRQFERLNKPYDPLDGPHEVSENEPTPIFDSVGKEDLGVGYVDSRHESTPIHDELQAEVAYQPRHRA
jgi:hypothetical protein